MADKIFKIGTRDSPLALEQANIVAALLAEAHQALNVEIMPIRSKADWNKDDGEKPLSEEAGGKGLFAKEIEQALLRGEIDCGVHSLKDMASDLPAGLVINHYIERANPHDAFICKNYSSLNELPKGAVIGSCSARRVAIALHKRPDLNIVPFRGNVQTRLDKVNAGQVEATFLAMAGLERLNIQNEMIYPLKRADMLPACGQGVICMESREDDKETHHILERINHAETAFCAVAEREVLSVLEGTCHTPMSAYATLEGDKLVLRAELYSLDGQQKYEARTEVSEQVTLENARACGEEVGRELLNKIPEGFLL